ncbi:DNA glycosylase AlkZ-like family protein [Rhodospirillaceae bacterium SYSU D60014]|uniref:DNA glycosylase AlkZ-like family protein n=1 Tax=Virgifigura deserti TaxID=2268457 RepID=UPI000E66B4FF
MRSVSQAELRAFLLDRLGLRGPFWGAEAADRAVDLGMIQIDSIRVTGLRNHELAWAARAESAPAALYDLLYGRGAFRELHYPLFAVRRDWVPLLIAAFADLSEKQKAARAALRPTMDRLMSHIRANGAVTVAQFSAERIPGGFSTIKVTTKALEFLYTDRVLQICGRTAHFHRRFDLTERVAPELAGWQPPPAAAYERFLVESALAVLKIGTAEQIARRVAIHYGQWRGASIRRWRALVEAMLPAVARAVTVADLPDAPVYWYRPADEAGWDRAARESEPQVRLVPPLDNLLFSRARLTELFGLDYKFEAYTPAVERRFYFALPILHDDEVAGLLDARLADGVWQIRGLELRRPVPAEALRVGLHRIARLAGAAKVAVTTRTTRELRRALVGRCDG